MKDLRPTVGHGVSDDMRFAVAALEATIHGIVAAEVPTLIGEVERLKALLWMKLPSGSPPGTEEPPANNTDQAADHLITAKEAAEILGVSVKWVYRNWRSKMPFGKKLGARTLRFPEGRVRKMARAR